MALTTYAELQASVSAWLHRSDMTALIPDFITLAESRMNGDLEARSMETRVTLTCVPGTTLAARYVALPTDMLEMRRLSLVDSDPATVLEYKSPDQLIADNRYLLAASKPACFTIIGANIELSPPPDSDYPIELIYQQKIPALSITNTTNWLLTAFPDIYLYGTLLSASPFTQDDERLAVYERKYQESVKTINSIDWYSGSTMRVRAR
jgi:hypothetical protein